MHGGRRFTLQEELMALPPAATAAIAAAMGFVGGTALSLSTDDGFGAVNTGLGVAMVTFVVALVGAMAAPVLPTIRRRADRREIVRAVRRGEAPADAALAGSVVAYAAAVQRRSPFRRTGRWWGLAFAVVFLGPVPFELADGQWFGPSVRTLLLVIVLTALPFEPRRLRRAAAAEAAARGFLNPG